MIARAAVILLLILIPSAAYACATCLWSAYGDRTFNWAFLGLIIMPFAVGATIGGILFLAHRRSRRRIFNPLFKETT